MRIGASSLVQNVHVETYDAANSTKCFSGVVIGFPEFRTKPRISSKLSQTSEYLSQSRGTVSKGFVQHPKGAFHQVGFATARVAGP